MKKRHGEAMPSAGFGGRRRRPAGRDYQRPAEAVAGTFCTGPAGGSEGAPGAA
ncbi:MAG: hypothetical protein AVDCRST_MAG39-412 [uncultured Sphingomonadaceae bacterium]|uniref:Uncharacterized protein n=1 Tax=uncultured Sphingomonadaceae bacterium TaxID=169976 RepID=A0A6J4RZ03_9SPHN|nr:MAG: hypothetical protein AVDCRST_MAG39-412 [uncultured Sphingomonadaceae bacterium]